MQQEQEVRSPDDDSSQEAFLGSFSRVPSGLDPVEVYSYFLKQSAQIRQLEERARQTSAPFVLEAALRDATEIRTQAAQAAERTYNELVGAAQQESARLQAEAQQQADRMLEEARATLAEARQEADALLATTRQEADGLRGEAERLSEEAEQELERLCIDFAGFLQRLVERRRLPASPAAAGASSGLAVEAELTAPFPETAEQAESVPAGETPLAAPQLGSSNGASPEAAPRPVLDSSHAADSPGPPPTDASSEADRDKPPAEEKPSGFRLPSWLDG